MDSTTRKLNGTSIPTDLPTQFVGMHRDATFYMVRKGAAAMFESIPVEFANEDNSVSDVKFSVGAQAMPLYGMKPLF